MNTWECWTCKLGHTDAHTHCVGCRRARWRICPKNYGTSATIGQSIRLLCEAIGAFERGRNADGGRISRDDEGEAFFNDHGDM